MSCREISKRDVQVNGKDERLNRTIGRSQQMKCPKCGSSDHDVDAIFCAQCGQDLTPNHCTNPNCPGGMNFVLKNEDLYCKLCGGESFFLQISLLKRNDKQFLV